MKLVMRYNWCVPYEADGTEVIPFEYSSKEDAFIDFETIKENSEHGFEFFGHFFDLENAEETEFFELEEWFERYKLG